MTSVAEMRKTKKQIHKAYLVSCVNARVDDIKEAADVIRGKRVADNVEFYVAAASSEVQAATEESGDWQALLDAGAKPLPAGCGPCIGMGEGLLGENEVGISATNRNFKGRMGDKTAEAYLGSPSVVAASAISGYIDLPDGVGDVTIAATIESHASPDGATASVALVDGFPATMQGELLYCHLDNLNTDGIYPGKYTYKDDMTPEQQAEVAMENYDTDWQSLAQATDILVGGYNFGTGSSREQAATALKYRGIQVVIGGSFSETYKRNAINNGFLAIECPRLTDDLKKAFGADKLTVRSGWSAKIDFASSTIEANGRRYSIPPVGAAAQELIVAGGLEAWVAERL
jgi:homoaconitate hydratase